MTIFCNTCADFFKRSWLPVNHLVKSFLILKFSFQKLETNDLSATLKLLSVSVE